MARGEMLWRKRAPRKVPLTPPNATPRLVGEAVYDAIRQCALRIRKAVEAAREEAAPREPGGRRARPHSPASARPTACPSDTGSQVGESLFYRVNDAPYTDGRSAAVATPCSTAPTPATTRPPSRAEARAPTTAVLLKGGGTTPPGFRHPARVKALLPDRPATPPAAIGLRGRHLRQGGRSARARGSRLRSCPGGERARHRLPLGGTAWAAPCHIAALPQLGCCAKRLRSAHHPRKGTPMAKKPSPHPLPLTRAC